MLCLQDPKRVPRSCTEVYVSQTLISEVIGAIRDSAGADYLLQYKEEAIGGSYWHMLVESRHIGTNEDKVTLKRSPYT